MARYLLHRLLFTLPALFLVVTFVFLLIHLIPGDPVEQMLGEGARAADVAEMRHALGLDAALGVQYAGYLKNLIVGNLGTSFRFNAPVRQVIVERYPATLQLALASLLVAILIAIPSGVEAALRRGKAAEQAIGFFTLLGISVPNFALGPILILVFAIEIGWLPVSGRGSLDHLVLPAVTLGGSMAAILTRMVRASMLEELSSDYVRTARAKGLPEWKVVYGHALRNGLIPVITIVGLQFGALLAGTIVTETIFSWPGIGRLTIQAIQARDYPLVQGCILAIALTYVIVNFLTDLVYSLVDPRIRRQ